MRLINILKAKLRRRFYIIGYGSTNDINFFVDSKPKNVRWIKFRDYKINWFADPYILSETDSFIEFLVEEWIEDEQKGRLTKFSYEKRSGKIFNKKIILDLKTHLSFPSIVREGNIFYICPENAASGKQKIYQYNLEKALLENPITIINEALLDVNIVKIDNNYYAFGIKLLEDNKCDNYKLRIYRSDNLLGHYEFYQEIDNNLAQERGAGSLFWYRNKLIRPVQNCEGDYGCNVIFKEVILKDGVFRENVIGGIFPNCIYPEGLHTFNTFNSTYVIDSMAYDVGNWMTYIKRVLRRW